MHEKSWWTFNGRFSRKIHISKKCVYACECNFYTSGGSKLNETARSYKTLALESKGIKDLNLFDLQME